MKFRKSIIHPIIIIFSLLLTLIILVMIYNVYYNLNMMQEFINSVRITGISNTITNVLKLEFNSSKQINSTLLKKIQNKYSSDFKNDDFIDIFQDPKCANSNTELVILLDDKFNLIYIKDDHFIMKSLTFNQILLDSNTLSKYTIRLVDNHLLIFGQISFKLGTNNYTLVTANQSLLNNLDFGFDQKNHFMVKLLNGDIILQYPNLIKHDDNPYIYNYHVSKTILIENEKIDITVGFESNIFNMFGINNAVFVIGIIVLLIIIYCFIFYYLYNVIINPLQKLKLTLFNKIKELTDNDNICDFKFRDNTNEIQYLISCFDFFINHIRKCVDDVVDHRNKLSKLINSISVGIVEIDSKTFMIKDINTYALDLIGLTREECIDKYCYDFLCTSSICTITESEIKCIAADFDGHPYVQDCLMENKTTHKKTPILKSIVNIIDNNITLILVSFISIEELKLKEEELRKALNRADLATKGKSVLLGNVSHDIGNILTSLKGSAEILQRDSLDPQQQQLISVIIDNSIAIANAVELMRERTLLETGQSKLKLQSANLIELITRIYRSCLIKCKDKNIDFISEGFIDINDRKSELYVIIDSNKFQAIITNLLDNATKFTKTGHVKSTIVVLSNNENIINLKFLISDTGIGIPKEALDSIFNIYEQANENIQTVYGGTGVGLSICQHYTSMMGGNIKVESKLDVGSTFSFSLFFDKCKKDETLIPFKQIEKNTDTLRILVAEDSNAIQQIIADKLKQLNCIITIVSNGRDAINLIRVSYFDLVLLDIRMPIMSGLEAAEIIRSEKFQLPIIALTANSSETDIEKYLEVGFDGIIPKPVSDVDLNLIIMKFKNRQLLNIDFVNSNYTTPNFFQSILEITQEEFKLNMEMLNLFEQDSNFTNLQHYSKAAHAIKSVASQIGMESVRHISHILENKFNGGINFQDVNSVVELISLLKFQFQKSLEYYDAHVKG